MGAALIFNGHASPTRHDELCRRITERGGAVLLVRPPGSAPHSGGQDHGPGLFRQMVLDASQPDEVARAFGELMTLAGRPELLVFDGAPAAVKGLLDWTDEDAARCWRGECLAALVVARQSLHAMLPAGRGTVIFMGQGEAAALRGPFSMGRANKAGTRALAQSMARAFGPRNIHVVHVALASDPSCGHAEGLGEICWQLHHQHRTAWTHELDLC